MSLVTFNLLPGSDEGDNRICREPSVDELTDEIKLRDEGGLKNDGDVAGVEELDGVRSSGTTLVLVLNGEIDTESLEEDNDGENDDGSQEVGNVR